MCYHFADQFVSYVLPNILNALIKTREDLITLAEEDDQEWNVVNASAFCLSQFALLCKESIVPQTIEFIEKKLLLPEELQPLILWNEVEAAVTAFGCILQGPCKFKTKPLVEQVYMMCINKKELYRLMHLYSRCFLLSCPTLNIQ